MMAMLYGLLAIAAFAVGWNEAFDHHQGTAIFHAVVSGVFVWAAFREMADETSGRLKRPTVRFPKRPKP